ncbi:hypothetical protein CBR_g39953 [Chara braunii]|uniref:Uncharacterized protein n=1 Tax=Chara braunii TaxID=69332 RepID=A0A388K1P0_CHABU|nr:hypothetical protein CBR_g39953 [Chara braunii]|eukprot:GBG63949.1 hypothetical protein CBR_g39953 [Chara braunii]
MAGMVGEEDGVCGKSHEVGNGSGTKMGLPGLSVDKLGGNGSILSVNFSVETQAVHSLPCSIQFNGPASVSKYLVPKETDMIIDGLQVKEAAFRGRKLLGTTIPLPNGYGGIVLSNVSAAGSSSVSSSSSAAASYTSATCSNRLPSSASSVARRKKGVDSNAWQTDCAFDRLTYWNHDVPPTSGDAIKRALDWLVLADAIHSPVQPEEVEAAIKLAAADCIAVGTKRKAANL